MIDFNENFSRNILLRLVILLAAVSAVLAFNLDFIQQVYFRDQLTHTGLIINASIFGLFFLGMLKMIVTLLRYRREEKALATFLDALDEKRDPTGLVAEKTLINRRFETLRQLNRQGAPINHNALAAMLQANESTRISFPKFINNILILTGVFGTIVSLSIALIGASNLLDVSTGMGDMGLVFHGMSTALSTTITAIVSYFIYGYFYLKLSDALTHLLSGIEQATSIYLLPIYSRDEKGVLRDVSDLIRGLRDVSDGMQSAQISLSAAASELREMVTRLNQQVSPMGQSMDRIQGILREGFRLPAKEE